MAACFRLSQASCEGWGQVGYLCIGPAGCALLPALWPGSPRRLPAVTADLLAAGRGPGPGDTKLEKGEDRRGLQV